MTILEALENAEYNINQATKKQVWNDCTTKACIKLGFSQLHNATILLVKGYDLFDEIDEVMAGRKVEDVPDRL